MLINHVNSQEIFRKIINADDDMQAINADVVENTNIYYIFSFHYKNIMNNHQLPSFKTSKQCILP